ncbi:MAG: tetratricopeptide repeat protein [Bacteroidota bacterium]
MRTLFISICLLLAKTISFGQTNEIDSLRNLLANSEHDTSYVQTLNILAHRLYRANPSEGIEYARMSITLSKKLSFDKGLARAYNSMGSCFWNLTELDSAIFFYKKSYEINDKLGLARGTTGALSNIAIIYENKGDYVNAINTYTQALEIMEREGFVDYAAITTNNLGIALMNIGSYPEALDYFHKAFDLADSLGMMNLIGPTLVNIGRIYASIDEPELQLRSVMKALKMGEEANDQFVIALASNNLGNLYRTKGKFDSAMFYFRKALSMNEAIGRKSSIILNLSNIGVTYRDQGFMEESSKILERALEIATETGQSLRISRVNYQLGLTTKERKSCKEALPYFLRGYGIAKKGNRLREIENLTNELYLCYQSLGKSDSAFKYLLEYTSNGDSIINEENIKEMAKIESRYQFENQIKAKNSEIELLESREELANLKITLLVIGVILVAIIAFFISRMLILKRERRKKELEAITKFRESMTSMIAHDLKTPLSVIMNSSNGDDANRQMAGQMLQLINNMLDVHRFESTEVNLRRENVSLQSIVEEAKAQVDFLLEEKDLTFKLEKDRDFILNVDKAIIVRVFMNLLTNAIKYSPFNNTITISCLSKDHSVTIGISDKGSGIPDEQKEFIFRSFGQLDPKDLGGIGSTGLGLTFVKLALLAHDSEIQVESVPGEGTTFSFLLPFTSVSDKAIKEPETINSVLTDELKKSLRPKVQMLKSLSLYQVGDIENEISKIREGSDKADQWAEEILKSVYAGNKEKYEQLIKEIEDA